MDEDDVVKWSDSQECGYWSNYNYSYRVILDTPSNEVILLREDDLDGSVNMIPISLLIYSKMKYHSCFE